jgi:hypothetical protein
MLATVASLRCSGVIPGSGGPLGCGMDGPCLPPETGGCPPWTAESLLSVTAFAEAEGAPLSALPAAPLEAAVLEAPEPGLPEPSEAPELELSEEDPPPQPASASAATASARRILALAVLAGFIKKR